MPDEPSVDESAEPSDEIRAPFWILVGILDVAMLATALGLLLVYEDRLTLGGGSLAIGLFAFAVCYRRVSARRNS